MYQFGKKEFDRHGTEVIKWDRMEQDFGKDGLIPLGIADMDFETLPEITKALTDRAAHLLMATPMPLNPTTLILSPGIKKRNHMELKKKKF